MNPTREIEMFKVDSQLDNKAVNTIRMLAADMVEKANSGHPGLPLGAALPWPTCFGPGSSEHNPANPKWTERDRFMSLGRPRFGPAVRPVAPLHGYDLPME